MKNFETRRVLSGIWSAPSEKDKYKLLLYSTSRGNKLKKVESA